MLKFHDLPQLSIDLQDQAVLEVGSRCHGLSFS
jgi:hypothetical protein